MTEKTKRKGNPRRRLLLKLLLISFVIIGITGASWYLLQPSSDRIVYIAEDENRNFSEIYIINLDNPENHRLVAKTNSEIFVSSFHVSRNTATFRYSVTGSIQTLNLNIGEMKDHGVCDCVTHPLLSDDGKWIVFQEFLTSDYENMTYRITLINIETNESTIIHESITENTPLLTYGSLQWITNQNIFIFNDPIRDENEVSNIWMYDIKGKNLSRIGDWQPNHNPIFSPDGSLALSYDETSVYLFNNFELFPESNWDIDIYPEQNGFHFSNHRFGTWLADSSGFIMIEELRSQTDGSIEQYNIAYYDIPSRTKAILSNYSYNFFVSALSSKPNSSDLLYRYINRETYEAMTIIYNMRTGEEQSIPLDGISPMWVSR